MSVFQAFARLFGWLMNSPVMLGHWGFQIFRRPLIAGMICGLVMGDVTKGVMVGAVLQALYIGTMNVGESRRCRRSISANGSPSRWRLCFREAMRKWRLPWLCRSAFSADVFAGFADERQSNYIAQSG